MDTQVLYPTAPPESVTRPVMLQGWRQLTYVHWPYDPAVVHSQLPPGLEVDTFDGSAWVGLVAFHMERVRLPRTPAIPYLGTFCETNVRTYVRGPDGRPGVWFDSLDVTRLLPVAVARASYRLPYMWSRMRMEQVGEYVIYSAQRRWPEARGATSELTIRRRAPIEEPSPLENFLTARWGLYTQLGKQLAYAPVDHEPWPLQQADLLYLDDDFMTAAGYPPPQGDPLVHYSPGVEVRIGLPRKVADA